MIMRKYVDFIKENVLSDDDLIMHSRYCDVDAVLTDLNDGADVNAVSIYKKKNTYHACL